MGGYVRRFEVRWADLDVNRHMRNTAYSEYATHVRVSFLRENGFSFEEFGKRGFGPVILREEARYYRELVAGDSLEVDFRIGGLSPDGSRWLMEHQVRRADGKRAAVLRLEGVWLDLATRRPMPPPAELAEVLRRVLRTHDFEELTPVSL